MNEELWKQARGLTQKLKKQQRDETSIGEKLIEWTLMGIFVLLILAFFVIPLIVYFIWSHAYVLVKLWAWFIVPIFHLEPITWAQAWGLMIAVAFLTHVPSVWKGKDERETHEKVTEFVTLCLKPWLVLVTAWVCARYFLHLI